MALIPDSIQEKIADTAGTVNDVFWRTLGRLSGYLAAIQPGGALWQKINQEILEDSTVTLLDIDTAAELFYVSNQQQEELVRSELQKAGYGSDKIDAILDTTRNRLGIFDLVEARRRGVLDEDQFNTFAERVGYTGEQADVAYELGEELLPVGEAAQLIRRRRFEDGDVDRVREELKSQGFDEEGIDMILEATQFFPNPQDVVTWTGKEVFEPETIEAFGLDEEFDRINKDLAKAAGVNEEQLRNFWIAHWQHPSFRQMQEMFTRQVPEPTVDGQEVSIETDEGKFYKAMPEEKIEDWMRLVELPPFWRDRFEDIMYRVPTRVDIRRFHRLGLKSESEVKRLYMSQGFNERDAELMKDFTVAFNSDKPQQEMSADEQRAEELKGLTRAKIQKLYEEGVIDQSKAKDLLEDIELSSEVSEKYLQLSDLELEEDRIDNKIDTIEAEFTAGAIDINEAINRLGKLDIRTAQRDKLIAEWREDLNQESENPSKQDLIQFLKQDIIDRDTFRTEMSNIGYNKRYTNWYIESVGKQPLE